MTLLLTFDFCSFIHTITVAMQVSRSQAVKLCIECETWQHTLSTCSKGIFSFHNLQFSHKLIFCHCVRLSSVTIGATRVSYKRWLKQLPFDHRRWTTTGGLRGLFQVESIEITSLNWIIPWLNKKGEHTEMKFISI